MTVVPTWASCQRRIWSARRRSFSSQPTVPRIGGKCGNGRGRSVMGARARSSTSPPDLQTRLGYTFRDRALVQRALTHASVGGESNERLEFLGDRVLGLVIAQRLFEMY